MRKVQRQYNHEILEILEMLSVNIYLKIRKQ